MVNIPTTGVKICGLSTAETADAAVQAGASLVGFVFFPKSPRNLSPELAGQLGAKVPKHVLKTGLFVKQTPTEIASICQTADLDVIQMHGTYTAAEMTTVKALTSKPIIWARGISSAEDFDGVDAEMAAADCLLFDAKPPKGSDRPGGNAIRFDWKLLANKEFDKPWMLAGGLNPENVSEAIQQTGAKLIDVSSGVEDTPGQKSIQRIHAFVSAVKNA